MNLQDAAAVAVVGGFLISVALNIYQWWKKRQGLNRDIYGKLAEELRAAYRQAASPGVPAWLGHFETFRSNRDRLPVPVRREIDGFVDLCERYGEAHRAARDRVKLAIYEQATRYPQLFAVPKSALSGSHPWIVSGPSGGRTSRDTFPEALIEALGDPLLRGESVRWSWLRDHEREFTDSLMEITNELTMNEVLTRIEQSLKNDPALNRLREARRLVLEHQFHRFARTKWK